MVLPQKPFPEAHLAENSAPDKFTRGLSSLPTSPKQQKLHEEQKIEHEQYSAQTDFGGLNSEYPSAETELQFEILILNRNIDKFKELGMPTGKLCDRLAYCCDQLEQLNMLNKGFHIEHDLSSAKPTCRDLNSSLPTTEAELQFEILILNRNIEKFKILGMDTEKLRNRLTDCNSLLSQIKNNI